MMNCMQDDTMAQLANDLFNKRQRLLEVGQSSAEVMDDRSALELEAAYRAAEMEYSRAQAAFARAMKGDHKHNG